MRAKDLCRDTPVKAQRSDQCGLCWLVLARDSPWPFLHLGPMAWRAGHNDPCQAVNNDTLHVFRLVVNDSKL